MSELNSDVELPAGWAWARLGEIVEVLDHKRVPVSSEERAHRSGSVPYYGATGQVGWIDEALFDEELVLLGEDGVKFFDRDRLKAYKISGPSWVNNHVHVLRARTEVAITRFLVHYLNSFNYEGYANGTTRLKLTKSSMSSIPVPLPPLEEQHRIVEALEDHLSLLDAGHTQLSRVSGRSKKLVQQLVTYQLKDMPTFPLSDLLRAPLINGRSVPSEEGGFPVLRLTALKSSKLNLREHKEGRWSAEDAASFVVARGDFFVSRGNGSRSLVGRGALLDEDPVTPIAFPDTMIRIRPNPSVILPEFLQLIWDSSHIRQYIETSARTTAGIYKINQAILQRTPVPVPTLEVQRSILARMETLITLLRQGQRMVDYARSRTEYLRASLLRRAFTGKLVPQDPADESASALLDRIRAEREAQSSSGKSQRATRRPRKAATAGVPPPPPPPAPSTPVPTTAVQQELPL